uniref:Acetyl-coenzyme A carboxylase carboxyl transferase subunit beta, chloroplastic n=1 Tax=prasinophyte sp. MBIC10622 TaxID=156113 RepID=A0A088CJM3_9CHLO|nr:beta subunit of acetyl-CoA carboxylase carboxytransferase [prasinophyte sp. MBIC10622]
MSLIEWFEDRRRLKKPIKYTNNPLKDRSKGLWTQCESCGEMLYVRHLLANYNVCTACGAHLRMKSTDRINFLVDTDTWEPLFENLTARDPINFTDQRAYSEKYAATVAATGLNDAVQTGLGKIYDTPVALGVMDFRFIGGSMGSVVGEKITRLIETAIKKDLPLIILCASGGARMQEGIFSLMQMAKISAALQHYKNATNKLYIPILTNPTTGGVTASFAMLGDIIIAEPKALIAFAGRRVIEQTIQEELPENFQTAEYLMERGFIDLIIPRLLLKPALGEIMAVYNQNEQSTTEN